jgi:hypothetical protein
MRKGFEEDLIWSGTQADYPLPGGLRYTAGAGFLSFGDMWRLVLA